MTLHLECVSTEMMGLLKKLMSIEELNLFRLVGGTALALQFGHRSSVDIDLFAGGRANPQAIPKIISSHFGGEFQLISQNRNGIVGTINNIKVDIVDWKVSFAELPISFDGIRMATAADIFASKCDALLDRKVEKDFVDIAVIASRFDLPYLFSVLQSRYSFITTGAITSFLLRRDLIDRDASIRYFNNQTFDSLADGLQNKILEYERNLVAQKQTLADDRDKKIRELINKKRNKPA